MKDVRGRWTGRWIVAVAVLLTALVGMAATASATHFRGGEVRWVKVSGSNDTVDFTVRASFRRSGYSGTAPDGFPAVGDVISEDIGGSSFDFDDGSLGTGQLNFRVDAINPGEDYLVGTALEPGSTTDPTITHQYATAGPFSPGLFGCCTISELLNNPDGNYGTQALVNLTSDDESPVASIPPVVNVGGTGTQNFTVPASDPGGETLRWRLATAAEACQSLCTDPNPTGLTINASTGQVSWDTTGLTQGLYTASVVVEALSGPGGSVVSASMVTFLIRVGTGTGNAAPAFEAPSPADGQEFTVAPGQNLQFGLQASDPDTGDTVTIFDNGLPPNATFSGTPGNPATGTFSFTPSASQNGQDIIVSFTAQDDASPPASDLRSYTIHVRSAATTHTLTVNKNGTGTGTVTSSPAGIACGAACSAQFADGTTVTLTGTPDAGSQGPTWAGCDSVNAANQCVVNMDGAKSVTATFTSAPTQQTCDGRPATIVGTAGNDNLHGTDGPDVILALGGDDHVNARDGNDVVCAGSGKDHVVGVQGNDRIFGEGDDDHLIGNAGDDRLDGGPNRDKCQGGNGGNVIVACES